jgi:hypothetical protein
MVGLALQYHKARTIHSVFDYLNIHRRKSMADLLGDQVGGEIWGRFTAHYTSVHGSWPQSGGDRNWHSLAAMPRQR